ncbi:MAG: ester cyclase [Pseudomonadota bacterium]
MDNAQNERNRQAARALWARLDRDPASASDDIAGATWDMFEPVGPVDGVGALGRAFFPLRAALPDLERQTHLLMAGRSDTSATGDAPGDYWVAGTGYYTGTGAAPLFGIPIAGHAVRLRWGEFLRYDNAGRLTYAQTIWDLTDLAQQVGTPILPAPRGASHVWPAATGYDGVLTAPQDTAETDATMTLARNFIFGGLNAYEGDALEAMGMASFFHPNVKWYGPGGIGACLSLSEFEERHQRPWLAAFPDRKVKHLGSLFADGRLLAGSGPRGVVATHTGPYLGHPPSGAAIEVSGLDFWLRQGDVFTENWVFVDMIHLFAQMGHDLLERFHDA